MKFLSFSAVAPIAAGAAPPTAIPVPIVARPVASAAPRYLSPSPTLSAVCAASAAPSAEANAKSGTNTLIMTITPINEPAFISIAFLVFKGLPSFLLLSITKNGSIISASANKGSKNSNIFQFLPKLIQISLKRLKTLSVAYIETTEYLIKFKS